MLKRLKVTNFGKHRAKEVVFDTGLNTVVGPNEGGKSTLGVEAIGYAFFGVTMLRESLADTVTTGEKDSTLQVELEYDQFKILRSKSSASVTGPGISISGQNEVSNFFYEHFGIKKGTEKSILIAEQGDIQGILSARGNAKAIEFIEDIAGFTQIDELIEKLKSEYPCGNKTLFESQIEEKQAVIDRIAAIPPKSTEEDENRIFTLGKELEQIKAQIPTIYNQIIDGRDKLAAEMHRVEQVRLKREFISSSATAAASLQKDIEEAANNLSECKETHHGLKQAEGQFRAILEQSKLNDMMLDAYRTVTGLKPNTAFEWEGDLDGLKEEIERLLSEKRELQDNKARVSSDLARALRPVDEKDTCELCGSDIRHKHEEMKAANEKLAAVARESLEEINSALSVVEEEIMVCVGIKNEHETQERKVAHALKICPNNIEVVDQNTLPRTYTWLGPVIEESNKETREKAESSLALITQLESQISALDKQISSDEASLKSLLGQISDAEKFIADNETEIDIASELNEMLKELRNRKDGLDRREREISEKVARAKDRVAAAKSENDLNRQIVAIQTEEVRLLKEKIKEDEENYSLLKAVREARPKVINRIWNVLLSTTAEYFSSIRGRPCEIVRTDKTFTVDGEKAGRLSGSTRDALGLAIRAATCEVFAPRVDFMLLDEIAAGMDAERTARAVAMVAELPIEQVVLCTHELVSDTVAANVIEV